MRLIRTLAGCLVAAVWLPADALPGPADKPALKLSGVPDRLVFPLPDGRNQVLAATVSGGTVVSAWLAADRDARLRAMLTKVGANEYEINLADPDVAAALASERGRKQFRVFAETSEGAVIESIAVRYSFQRPASDFRPAPAIYVELAGGDAQRLAPGQNWFDAQQVAAIELGFEEDATPAHTVRAQAGEETWDFAEVEPSAEFAGQRYLLPLDARLRDRWQEHGELRVEYRDARRWHRGAALRARPTQLDLPGTVAALTVYQRTAKAVPGSRGYLSVRLGDITAGRVLVTLSTADGNVLADDRALRQGESLAFELAGGEYVLYLRELVNVLIGEDWAEFECSGLEASVLDRIERLLEHVARAELTFLREGQEYTARETAAHLRRKLAFGGPRIDSVAEFIDKLASRSSTTGRPYLVKLKDGSTIEAKAWLEEEAARLEGEEIKPGEPQPPAPQE